MVLAPKVSTVCKYSLANTASHTLSSDFPLSRVGAARLSEPAVYSALPKKVLWLLLTPVTSICFLKKGRLSTRQQISPSKSVDFPRILATFIPANPWLYWALMSLANSPNWTSFTCSSCFLSRRFGSGFPQTLPHDNALPPLMVAAINLHKGTFHPLVNAHARRRNKDAPTKVGIFISAFVRRRGMR